MEKTCTLEAPPGSVRVTTETQGYNASCFVEGIVDNPLVKGRSLLLH